MKFLTILLVAVVAIALNVSPSEANPAGVCYNAGDVLADTTDCRIYYVCDIKLDPIAYRCIDSLCFDHTTNTCDTDFTGGCGC
ncbi:hypothetical protein CHUAL_001087 [Chamberlinius hualienensis]